MKKYLNFRFVFGFCMVLSLVLAHPFAVFADVKDLMIATDANALMTLELDDSDYLMMSPRSSVGTVTNTIKSNGLSVSFSLFNDSGDTRAGFTNAVLGDDNRYHYSFDCPAGYYIGYIQLNLFSGDLPPAGSYDFSYDIGSHFSYGVTGATIWTQKRVSNASSVDKYIDTTIVSSSGDVFCSPIKLNLTNVFIFAPVVNLNKNDKVSNVGGSFALKFVPISSGDYTSTAGSNTSDADYQSGVSSSLSDLSSSVGEMSDEISGVTEAIQNLQGAMEPHYNNVLTQLHHITEQLHAFWDQQFNLHHVPLMAKLSDIIDAIGNMDLEVEVNLNSLKTSIDTMSQNVQNKLQSVSDTITGGYDNSGMESENDELSGAVDELDQAEKEVLDDVTGYIEGFEYPTFESLSVGLLGAIAFFGGFLQSMFLAMGDFGLIITFSLTMIFVLIIVGYHRIRT